MKAFTQAQQWGVCVSQHTYNAKVVQADFRVRSIGRGDQDSAFL